MDANQARVRQRLPEPPICKHLAMVAIYESVVLLADILFLSAIHRMSDVQ